MAIFDRDRYLDRRTYKRHVKRGTLTEEQFRQYINDLPDMTDNIMAKEEGGDEDGYEQRVEADGEGDEGEASAEGEALAAEGAAVAPAAPGAPEPAAPAAPAPAAAPAAPAAPGIPGAGSTNNGYL